MPQTNLQSKIDYYKRVIEDSKKTKTYEKYSAVCTELEKLVEFSDTLNNPDKKMTQTDFNKLNALYSAVQQACSVYLGEEKTTKYEKAQERIIKDIARVLEKDTAELAKCDTSKPAAFSEIIENARRYNISISSNDYKAVGAALSSRIPLKTPSGKKGFFTPVSTYKPEGKVKAAIDKHINAIAEKYPETRKNMERFKTDKKLQEEFLKICPSESIEELRSRGLNRAANAVIIDVAKYIGIGKSDRDVVRKLNNDTALEDMISDFIRDIAPIVNQKGVMEEAGIKEGANISGRNCAMTDMAKLLGCENLLANSTHMTIMIDGQPVKGVFMETAEGTDINRLSEGDFILKGKTDMCDNHEVLSQATDLQILDFVCGNIDRHMGNMIYNVVKDENGKISVKGIKGIDNDCAFGTVDISKGDNVMSLVNIKGIQYIRTSMLHKLESIQNKAVLKYRLSGNGLSDDEIDAAWDRVEKVKEAAKQGIIKTVPDNYWQENSLSSLPVIKGGNYLTRIKSLAETANFALEDTAEITDIKYVADNTSKKAIYQKAKEIEKIRQQMDKVSAVLFNSSEYDLMEKSFKTIEKYSKEVRSFAKPEAISDELAKNITEAYKELADKTNRYVKLKKLIPSTTRGKNRIGFALGLLDFASTAVREIAPGLEKMDETKRDVPPPEINVEENIIKSDDGEMAKSGNEQNTNGGKVAYFESTDDFDIEYIEDEL